MLNGDRIRFVLAGAVLACSGACATGAPTHAGASWRTLAPAYAVQSGSGDIVASDGMSVTLVGPVGTHGSAFYVLSPSSYANRRITVEADMDSAPASGKAVIFANAKTVTGHRLFANAERGADLATAVGHRVFMLDVPSNVQYLSLGLGVTDGGKLEATRLHITTSPIPPHAAPSAVMDAVLSDIKAHALEAGRIDWPTVEPSMRAYALASEVPAEIYPQIDALIKMLGDGHSLWMRPGARHAYDAGGTSSVEAQVALRDESVGYVSMPGFPGMNAAMSAAFVHDIASRVAR